MYRRVKIVATLGPASGSEEKIAELIEAGVNIFRLNFSYGTHEEHGESIEKIRRIASKMGREVGILQDICGPKIRINGLRSERIVERGDILRLAEEPDAEAFSISFPGIVEKLKVGDELFFADGTIQSRVVGRDDTGVTLEVLTRGRLLDGKGVTIAKADVELGALTRKDISDIEFGARAGVDFVAISFVGSADDMHKAREIHHSAGGDGWMVAKIERRVALEHIDAIVDASDAVMVARGDLGAEAGVYRVPVLQKRIIESCNSRAKPVIVATQMLTSMVNSPYPTRAEVSDVANAVLDGADAVMLSDETAAGRYPVEAVNTLVSSIYEIEKEYPYYRHLDTVPEEALPHAASALSKYLPCDFIAVLTDSGYTMRELSKYRPSKPLFAIATERSIGRKSTLVWGYLGSVTPKKSDFSTESEMIEDLLLESGSDPDAFILLTGEMEGRGFGKSIRYIRREDRMGN